MLLFRNVLKLQNPLTYFVCFYFCPVTFFFIYMWEEYRKPRKDCISRWFFAPYSQFCKKDVFWSSNNKLTCVTRTAAWSSSRSCSLGETSLRTCCTSKPTSKQPEVKWTLRLRWEDDDDHFDGVRLHIWTATINRPLFILHMIHEYGKACWNEDNDGGKFLTHPPGESHLVASRRNGKVNDEFGLAKYFSS
jgi:hypothetical protein